MPDFRDSFTAREVCEGMLSQINVYYSAVVQRGRSVCVFFRAISGIPSQAQANRHW